MPELPEVEVVRLSLIPRILGDRIASVSIHSPGLREPFDRAARRFDLVFTDLVLQNDGDCLPDDGTVQGTLRRGDTEISWRLTDDNSGGLPAFQLNDDSRLAFAPFACVLNER